MSKEPFDVYFGKKNTGGRRDEATGKIELDVDVTNGNSPRPSLSHHCEDEIIVSLCITIPEQETPTPMCHFYLTFLINFVILIAFYL
jgi:hypothetical protein